MQGLNQMPIIDITLSEKEGKTHVNINSTVARTDLYVLHSCSLAAAL
jgi:hypothetical protein